VNRQIRRVAAAVGVLMLALLINLNYVQVVKSDAYRNNSGNRRVILTEYSTPRGQIVVQGTPIAESEATSDELKYIRTYSNGPVYAPVTGFYSLIYGKPYGLESAEDGILGGTDSRLFGSRLGDILTGRDAKGGSVVTTLNAAAQQAAYTAMSKQKGAVVAMDPTTGAILAAVSLPSYDPNMLSSHDTAAITAYWKSLNPDDPQSALVNRAFNQTYAPGSVFKVITSAAALKKGVNQNDTIPAPNSYWPLGGSGSCPAAGGVACVENFDGETCDNGTTATMAFAFAKSCNTAFAELGVEKIGGSALAAEAKLFGLDTGSQNVPVPVAASTIGNQTDLTDKAALAQTSFGQRDVRITPLQGAMIASAVANDGTLMTPYLVSEERAPDLSVLSQTKPEQESTVLDPDLDAQLEQMMVGVVQNGTGTAAQITPAEAKDPALAGVSIGGKTGTADTGIFVNGKETPPHAWFVGFATQNGTAKIAVAVIVENGGVNGNETTGGLAAAPIAKAVIEAYLKSVH
jgi:penicillin-binding protein A